MGFTMIIETLVLFLVIRLIAKDWTIPAWRIVVAGLFASFATIPYVWYVFPTVMDWPRNTSLLWSEPFIFLIEVCIYRFALGIRWRHAFFASLVCNLASYLIGPFLRANGLWIYW